MWRGTCDTCSHICSSIEKQELHTLLRMISGAKYSGVPHNVQVLPFTRLANPKSVTYMSGAHTPHISAKLRHSTALHIHFVCCGSPGCSRGGQWEGSRVSDPCIWGLVNGGTRMSALFGQHRTVHVVHCRRGRGKKEVCHVAEVADVGFACELMTI